MIKLDFYADEDLSNSVKRLISSVLPHQNYEGKFFNEAVNGLLNYIHLDEMPLDYHLLTKVLVDLSKIQIVMEDFSPSLSKESFQNILSSNIAEFISENVYDVKTWMSLMGKDFDYQNPENVQSAQVTLYSSCLNLYDECFELQVASNELPMLLLALKGAFSNNAVSESLKTQYEIYGKGARVGRKLLTGAKGIIEYTVSFNNELRARLDLAEGDTVILDDTAKMHEINQLNKMQSERIADWGIPQLDDCTPMLKSRLVVIAADEGVGKTLYSCFLSNKIIHSGHKVVYMCGESAINKIKNNISSNNIYKKYNKFVSAAQIAGTEDCSEEAQRLINISDADIVESGNLILKQTFTYSNIYDELVELYNATKFDVLFIDHSAALEDSPDSKFRTLKEKIDSMTIQLRNFKRKYPVMVVILSHLGYEASREFQKYGKIFSNITRESGTPQKEADELFILYKTEALSASGMIGMRVHKRRDKEAPRNDIILKVRKNVVDFEYRDEYQLDSENQLQKDQALQEISDVMNVNNVDDDLDFDIFDDED